MEAEAEGLAPDTSALEILDISGLEERTYLTLLASRSSTAAQIARELGVTSQQVLQALAGIEVKGLVTRAPNTPATYAAVEPEFAIEALIRQRQRALEHARSAIPALTETFARFSANENEQPVLELITDHARLSAVVEHMFKSFRSEIMCFQRAPILVPAVRFTVEVPPGARARSISDKTYLDAPDGMNRLHEDVKRGEEARTYSNLPFKMMVVDRSIATITLGNPSTETAPTLLLHRSALLEALCLLFEFVWEKATPMLTTPVGQMVAKERSAVGSTRALIPLLAAGLNDKAIAHELRISASTLNRRIGDLMDAYGVRTRFQLGLQVALNAETLRVASAVREKK